jgi:hypothetical protein
VRLLLLLAVAVAGEVPLALLPWGLVWALVWVPASPVPQHRC